MANPAQPAPDTRLCTVGEIAEPGAKGFVFREGEALFMGFVTRFEGQVIGYIDRCPHTGLPLEMFGRWFTREGDLLICASHGALFKPDTGLCVGGPCVGRSLWTWPIRVEDGDIFTA